MRLQGTVPGAFHRLLLFYQLIRISGTLTNKQMLHVVLESVLSHRPADIATWHSLLALPGMLPHTNWHFQLHFACINDLYFNTSFQPQFSSD